MITKCTRVLECGCALDCVSELAEGSDDVFAKVAAFDSHLQMRNKNSDDWTHSMWQPATDLEMS